MREIKFRVWDTYNKKMIPKEGGFSLGSADSEMVGGEDYPIMQYTGLHDKNGKEIYEGDILQIRFFEYGPDEVVFIDACFELYGKDGHYACDLKQVYSVSEVVGNIYENPELLETK